MQFHSKSLSGTHALLMEATREDAIAGTEGGDRMVGGAANGKVVTTGSVG